MRILVGTTEICRHLYDLGEAFRALGHEVNTVASGYNPFYQDLTYDHRINPEETSQWLAHLMENPFATYMQDPEPLRQLRELLLGYDVYVFQFAQSFLPANQDYPILKQLGKKIISIFNGSDIRHWSGAQPVADAYGYQIPEMCYEAPFNILSARLHNLRMAERYADGIFSLPFQSELAVRPYWHFFLPFNLDLYEQHIPDNEVPVFVHAPSRRKFKGTDVFLATLDRLKAEGYRFELKLLENVPNAQVIEALQQADVVLDELHSPHYAMLALEGMATGCAVVAGCNRDYVPMQGKSPVFDVRPHNLYDRLKKLLDDRSLRLDLARRGRPFVASFHSHLQVAQRFLDCLTPTEQPYDYYPTFFTTGYSYPGDDGMPSKLRALTAEVIQRHGLPAGTDVGALASRGLADPNHLQPSSPILPWPAADYFGVRPQVWGWSPHAEKEAEAPAPDPSEVLVQGVHYLVERALAAIDRGDTQMAHTLLTHLITHYQDAPLAMANSQILLATSRLGMALGYEEKANMLLEYAFSLDPQLREAQASLQALRTTGKAA